MVEQVRVNPEEVRGYGNICEGHTLEDFIVSNSGLAKEKEDVQGALTSVYRLVYSLYGLMFYFDKGNKQLYLQTAEADTLSFSFDTVNKQLYLVDENDTGFNLGFDEDTNELYITDDAPPSISISASSPYLLSGETTDLIVTLYDGVGAPLANKSVTVSDGTSLYSGLTNLNGIFTLYNVSVSQDTTFTATYSNVSDSVTVEYCRFVDYAVKDNHNHNYFNQQGTSKCTITENDSYKEFKTIGAIGCNVYIGSSTSYNGFDVGDTWTIIWDKLYIDGYTVAFQCYNGSTTVGINSTTLGLHNSDFQELKFVCDGSSIKAYVDGVYKTQTSYTSTGHGYLRISLNNNNGASQVTFRAKNIRIK